MVKLIKDMDGNIIWRYNLVDCIYGWGPFRQNVVDNNTIAKLEKGMIKKQIH